MHKRRKRGRRRCCSSRRSRRNIIDNLLLRPAVLVGLLIPVLLHFADGERSPLLLKLELPQGRIGVREGRASASGASDGYRQCRRGRRKVLAAAEDAAAGAAATAASVGRAPRVGFLPLPNIPQLSALFPCLEVRLNTVYCSVHVQIQVAGLLGSLGLGYSIGFSLVVFVYVELVLVPLY